MTVPSVEVEASGWGRYRINTAATPRMCARRVFDGAIFSFSRVEIYVHRWHCNRARKEIRDAEMRNGTMKITSDNKRSQSGFVLTIFLYHPYFNYSYNTYLQARCTCCGLQYGAPHLLLNNKIFYTIRIRPDDNWVFWIIVPCRKRIREYLR